MTFLKPTDSVHKIISLPRWQRDTIASYYTVNFSGLVQEKIVLPLIREKDPDIFAKFMPKEIKFPEKKILN